MKKDLIDTIMEKEFHALTDVERKELASFCSTEDEYNQMKDVFVGVEQMTFEQPQPKAETKQRLDELFDSTYPKAAPIWYSSVLTVVAPKGKPIHRQPLAQIAAIALLALLLIPFWNSDAGVVEAPQQLAQSNVGETDTRNTNGGQQANAVEVNNDDPTEVDVIEPQQVAEPVLVASAEPVASSDPVTRDVLAASSPGAPSSNHPDGVFIATSQPASENPEMFDLLTATF